jgi:hypothetical protein
MSSLESLERFSGLVCSDRLGTTNTCLETFVHLRLRWDLLRQDHALGGVGRLRSKPRARQREQ